MGNEWHANRTVLFSSDGKIADIKYEPYETEGISYINGIALVLENKAETERERIAKTLGSAIKGLAPFEAAPEILKENMYVRYRTNSIAGSVLVIIESDF